MDWYEAEVTAKECALHLACDGNPRLANPVFFYGSSSMRLWSSLPDDFPGRPVVNAGFGGSTLVACTWFFARLVAPFKPSRLVVYAGDNDLGDGARSRDFAKRFDDFLTTTEHFFPAIPLTVLSIKPSPARWGLEHRILKCNAIMAERLATRPNSLLIDIHRPMLGGNGLPRGELFQADRLHLSPAGYQLWTDCVLEHRQHVFGDSE